jgi:hypothetical protein
MAKTKKSQDPTKAEQHQAEAAADSHGRIDAGPHVES